MLEKDNVAHSILNNGKLAFKDIVPDISVTASIRMSMAVQEAADKEKSGGDTDDIDPIALILTVDLYSTIRLYEVYADLTTLVFAINLTDLRIQTNKENEEHEEEIPEVEIRSIDLFLKMKLIFITTLDN